MSQSDDATWLRHMLDHTREAVEMARGRSRQDLDLERQLNLSLARLLEILGEAANRVSEERQTAHPEVPWKQIIGLRNRLIHGDDSVDFDILWKVVTEDLPPLVTTLKKIASET